MLDILFALHLFYSHFSVATVEDTTMLNAAAPQRSPYRDRGWKVISSLIPSFFVPFVGFSAISSRLIRFIPYLILPNDSFHSLLLCRSLTNTANSASTKEAAEAVAALSAAVAVTQQQIALLAAQWDPSGSNAVDMLTGTFFVCNSFLFVCCFSLSLSRYCEVILSFAV